MSSHLSSVPSLPLRRFFQEISPNTIPTATKIFVNGAWVGIHRQPDHLVKSTCSHSSLLSLLSLSMYACVRAPQSFCQVSFSNEPLSPSLLHRIVALLSFFLRLSVCLCLLLHRTGVCVLRLTPHTSPALRSLRRCVDVSPEVSIVRDIQNQELRISTDAGRCCRPLFIVENQKLLIKKSHIRKLQRRVRCLF